MKTITKLFTLALVLSSQSLLANPTDDLPIPSPDKSTFWGSKASTHPNNPCKGATIRICGILATDITPINENKTLVTKTVKDVNGVIISESSYIVPKSIDTVTKEASEQENTLEGTIDTQNEDEE